MKTHEKYDPEDIESLMLHKQFHELYPEEKAFVLRHLESEEEYESMRSILMEIKDSMSMDQGQHPDKRIKHELMKEFKNGDQRGLTVWLNSLFVSDLPIYRRPAVIALAAVFTGAVLFIFSPALFNSTGNTGNAALAETVEEKKDSTSIENTKNTASIKIDTSRSNLLPEPVKPIALAMVQQEEQDISMEKTVENISAGEAEDVMSAAPASTPRVASSNSEQGFVGTASSTVEQLTYSEIESDAAVREMKSITLENKKTTVPSSLSQNMKNSVSLLDKLFTAR